MSFMKKRYMMSYKTREKLIIFDGKHENTFFLFGGKDAASYQLIQGITLAGVFLDEVALMPRSFVDQAIARCSVSGRRLWFNCNPEGQLHWFNQEWILEAESRNALHLHFTMDDNPSLAPEIREGYERMYSGIFYDRYIKGLWVSAEGVIYADMFNPDKNIISEEEVNKLEFDPGCWISCDYGIQNATVYLKWKKTKGKNVYVCVDEWYYSGRESQKQKTVTALVQGLKEFIGEDNVKYIIVDPSASALKVEMQHNKLHVVDARNEVINGIANTGKLLEDGYLLFSERCKNTIDEFDLYMWDEKAANAGEDVPIKENDHCMDAMRYFVNTESLFIKCYKKPSYFGY
jgi:PBSX family phage terminase large subunit